MWSSVLMQLAPMLFIRPGELRAAEWSEINLETAEWNIPADRMKMKAAHLAPLSRQAVEILKALHPLTGNSKYVFSCNRSPLAVCRRTPSMLASVALALKSQR